MDMGETAVDEQTFEEYIEEMGEHYTADKVCTPYQRLGFSLSAHISRIDSRSITS
jgi:hypothetical protein